MTDYSCHQELRLATTTYLPIQFFTYSSMDWPLPNYENWISPNPYKDSSDTHFSTHYLVCNGIIQVTWQLFCSTATLLCYCNKNSIQTVTDKHTENTKLTVFFEDQHDASKDLQQFSSDHRRGGQVAWPVPLQSAGVAHGQHQRCGLEHQHT